MQIDVSVRGDREAAALVERLARRLQDGRPQLLGLVDTLLAAEAARFAGAGRWKRISDHTRRRDARGHRNPELMVLTGALRRSLTVRGAEGQIVRVTPAGLRFGTSLFYARFHQRGQGVAKRIVVGVTRVQRQHLVAELRRLLLED